MHTGLVTPAVPTSDPAGSTLGTDLMITMLDGDLGAVTDPAGSAVLPRSDAFCVDLATWPTRTAARPGHP
jgi:hypothetical protein